MQRNLILTKDGSHTVAVPDMNVTYHSVHGAIQESMHVFIEAGFKDLAAGLEQVHIFEMGFGTGLNALLTLIEAQQKALPVSYTAVELFPLEQSELQTLNYCEQLNRPALQPVFEQLHSSKWEEKVTIQPGFTLFKTRTDLLHFINLSNPFHLIYFDAFAPSAQPELWTPAIFQKMYELLLPGGRLVTYCSKGDVRRAMQTAGFRVEKIPGPPGKREIVRAWK